MRTRLILTLLLAAVATLGNAQDFKSDYRKMQAQYADMTAFSCRVKVKVFEDEKSVKPSQEINSSMKKKENNYSYVLGTTRMIINANCILYIDEENRELTYTIRDTKREITMPAQDGTAMIDSLMKHSDSVVYTGTDSAQKHYIVYDSKGSITKTDVYMNDNNLLSRIIYHYNKKMYQAEKVEISYSDMDVHPVFNANEFSEKRYVTYAAGQLRPLGAYATYQAFLIDQNDIK